MVNIPLMKQAPVFAPPVARRLPRQPRVASPSPPWTPGPDIVPPVYYLSQHRTWNELYRAQQKVAPGLVCPEYLRSQQKLGIDSDKIPDLRELHARLKRLCGWGLLKAPGYVPGQQFFRLLEQKTFPCTDQLRDASEVAYASAPDMWHDVMGHLPMLAEPAFGEFNHVFGRIGARIRHESQFHTLGKIYWFTMEFGIIRPPEPPDGTSPPLGARLYGATLVSSTHEMTTSLTSSVERRPFSIEAVSKMKTDVSQVNKVLFEITSFESLLDQLLAWADKEHLI